MIVVLGLAGVVLAALVGIIVLVPERQGVLKADQAFVGIVGFAVFMASELGLLLVMSRAGFLGSKRNWGLRWLSRRLAGVVAAIPSLFLAIVAGLALDRIAYSLDPSPARPYVDRVLARVVLGGRNYLYLAHAPGDHRVDVAPALYDSAGVDGPLCLDQHEGWLGLNWMRLRACSSAEAQRLPAPAFTPGLKPAHLIYAPSGSDLTAFYPSAAKTNKVLGEGAASCAVTDEGALFDCRAVAERPAGQGFGAAAVSAAHDAMARPATRDGVRVEGQITVVFWWGPSGSQTPPADFLQGAAP